MKKLSLILALALIFTCVSASALTLSPAGEYPLCDETVTLTLFAGETVGRDYETDDMTKYLEEMMNIDIVWQMYSSSENGDTARNLSVASGEWPDIYTGTFGTAVINEWAEAGVALALDDLIEEWGVNYKIALEEQPQYKAMLTANDGHIYTFMYTDTGVHKDCEYKMWVNQAWLDKLGIAAPTTPEEFKEMLIAFRDNDMNDNGDATDELPLVGWYNGRKSDPICFLMNPFELYRENYYVITDDGEIRFLANTDGWREGLKYIADLYAEGLITPETYTQDETQFKALLNRPAAEAIVGTAPCWYLGGYTDPTMVNWTDYPAIAPLAGEYQQAAARQGGNFNLSQVITTTCENPEVAFRMLDYLISEEGTYFGHYGYEGVDWHWEDAEAFNGDSKAVVRDVLDVDCLWNSGTHPRYDRAAIRYGTTMNPEMFNSDNTYILYSSAAKYEPYYVWHNIPDVVWCADEDLIQERSDFQTDFNDYINTMNTKFVMGEIDINDDAAWEDYKAELDAMGLADYIDVVAQYYLG